MAYDSYDLITGISHLWGPKGKPRNFRAMGDDKLRALYEAWQLPLNFPIRSIGENRIALRLLDAEYDRRFNGIALPPDIVELLANLAGGER